MQYIYLYTYLRETNQKNKHMKTTTALLLIIITQIAMVLILTSDYGWTARFFGTLELIFASCLIVLYIDNNPNKIK